MKKRSRAGFAFNTNWIGIVVGVAIVRLIKPELLPAYRAGLVEFAFHVVVILAAIAVILRCSWFYLSVWRVHNALHERGFDYVSLGDSAYIMRLFSERGDGAAAADLFPNRREFEERHPEAARGVLAFGEALLRATPRPSPTHGLL